MQSLSKFFLAIAILSGAFISQANAEISAGQARAVLRSIDQACGDTWCESDYNFRFTDFVCDPVTKICKIVFFVDSSDPIRLIEGDGFKATFKNTAGKGSCTFSEISDISDMMDAKQNLNEKFYRLVDSCLSTMIDQASKAAKTTN